MKRLNGIMLFSFLLLRMSSIGTPIYRSGDIFSLNAFPGAVYDTTGYLNFLKVDSFKLEIVPPSSGIQFYKDGIVFLSLTRNEDKMLSKHISFGTVDAYYARLDDTILGKHIVFSPFSTFSYPCEAVTFNEDFSIMYFTRVFKKDNKEKIYLAKFALKSMNQSGWLLANVPLDFCTGDYNYAYPAISTDERIMIFSSDRTGSSGGMDLFITMKEGERWIAPENMGEMINSPGNEIFPFLDPYNNLYFSSDGLPGFGGYDIFTCKFNGEGWDHPVNLSQRINSETDDIAFTINKNDEKSAFFTKKQKSVNAKMTSFRITLKREAAESSLLTISSIFNGKPPINTRLTSLNGIIKSRNEILVAKKEPVIEKNEEEAKITLLRTRVQNKAPETVIVPDTVALMVTTKPAGKPESRISSAETKAGTTRPVMSSAEAQKDIVTFRVQFRSSIKPQKEKTISINGTMYTVYQYFYLGEYRNTVGEFSSVTPAIEFMKICRRSGYPQSFVAAFINNTRTLDPKLFK